MNLVETLFMDCFSQPYTANNAISENYNFIQIFRNGIGFA